MDVLYLTCISNCIHSGRDCTGVFPDKTYNWIFYPHVHSVHFCYHSLSNNSSYCSAATSSSSSTSDGNHFILSARHIGNFQPIFCSFSSHKDAPDVLVR